MAPKVDTAPSAETVDFLISVMMHTEQFQPNFNAVAQDFGINTASNAQRRFKTAVERSGVYECKKNLITRRNQSVVTNTGLSATVTSAADLVAGDDPAPKAKAGKKRAAPESKTNVEAVKRGKKADGKGAAPTAADGKEEEEEAGDGMDDIQD